MRDPDAGPGTYLLLRGEGNRRTRRSPTRSASCHGAEVLHGCAQSRPDFRKGLVSLCSPRIRFLGDLNSNGVQDAGDHYFQCPLLVPDARRLRGTSFRAASRRVAIDPRAQGEGRVRRMTARRVSGGRPPPPPLPRRGRFAWVPVGTSDGTPADFVLLISLRRASRICNRGCLLSVPLSTADSTSGRV